MKLSHFLYEKTPYILILTIFLVVAVPFLHVLGLNWYAIYFISSIYIVLVLTTLVIEFSKKRAFYQQLQQNLEKLQEKRLICEMIERPSFLEGEIFYDTLQQAARSMNEAVETYRHSSEEYREFIELWMHEVKAPIASCQLMIENYPSVRSKQMAQELDRVSYYLEQALFYARSSSVEKDYMLKTVKLQDLVRPVLHANARVMIEHHIKVEVGALEQTVQGDTKWVGYLLQQFIVNAIQYHQENPVIAIDSYQIKEAVVLTVWDNGNGISFKDLPRIFDKGFTGKAGRRAHKSTGMGLYLCKKLAKQLGLGLRAESIEGEFTKISLIFPTGSFTKI